MSDVRSPFYRLYDRVKDVLFPGLRYSQTVYEQLLQQTVEDGEVWLDLGCGHQILPVWRQDAERALVARSGRVVGVDYDHLSLTRHTSIEQKARVDITSLPFPDASFSLATANMVVEHLDDPPRQFAEIHRVLRPGGRLIVHTPNMHGYTTQLARIVPERLKRSLIRFLEGRAEDDVFPAYYRANREKDLDDLARKVGFDRIELRYLLTDAEFIMIPPVMLFELLWLRLLSTRALRRLRPNLLVVLHKEQG